MLPQSFFTKILPVSSVFTYSLKYFLDTLGKGHTNTNSHLIVLKNVCFLNSKKNSKLSRTNILLRTIHNCSFIVQNIGLVLPSRFVYKEKRHINLFVIKKKSFSFLKPNEYKMHIFNFRRKYMF